MRLGASDWCETRLRSNAWCTSSSPCPVRHYRTGWEKPAEPERLTPARVRRGFRNLRTKVGNPAAAPKPSQPGPGRPPGLRNRHPATRHDVHIVTTTTTRKPKPKTPAHDERVKNQAKPGWMPHLGECSRGAAQTATPLARSPAPILRHVRRAPLPMIVESLRPDVAHLWSVVRAGAGHGCTWGSVPSATSWA